MTSSKHPWNNPVESFPEDRIDRIAPAIDASRLLDSLLMEIPAMRPTTALRTCAILGALATAASAQSAPKVYGFADANFSMSSIEHSFAKSFLGADTFNLSLGHANIYFDFKPNERVSALVEVGLASRPEYDGRTSSQAPAVITFNGSPVSDAQAKAIIVQGTMAQQIANLVAQGLDQATATAAVTAQQPAIAAGVAAQFDPVLAQLRAQRAAETTTDKYGLNLERVHIDIKFRDEFKLRFGKFITPAGVWNVDHGSPVVLTVRQPLQTTTTPIFPESQTGMMGFGRTPLGDHDLDYSGYISAGRIDGSASAVSTVNHNSIDKLTDLAYGGHVGLKLDVLKSIGLGASYFNGPLRQKYATSQLVFALEDLLGGVQKPRDYTITDTFWKKERESVVGVDAKVEVSQLLLQAEYNYGHRENELVEGTAKLSGWYVLGAWTQPLNGDFALTPYVMYEALATETTGAGASGAFNDGGLEGLTTLQFGLNASIYSNVNLKTEYMFLSFLQDEKTWAIQDISEDDLKVGIWSTQVSVAF